MEGLYWVDSREHSRPVPDKGTQCAEVLRLEVLRGQLASPQSPKDATAWQQAGLTASLPGHSPIC